MKMLLSALCIAVLVLTGCAKDSPTDPGTNSTNQDYYQTTVGSKWAYKVDNGTTYTTENTGTTEQNGKTYTTATQVAGGSTSSGLIRNDGANVYVVNSLSNGTELNQLEYGKGAGHSWSYTINVSGTPNVYNFKIRELGATKTVEAGTYNDCLILDLDQSITVGPVSITNKGVYYISKGNGTIHVEFSGDMLNQTIEATSITIVK